MLQILPIKDILQDFSKGFMMEGEIKKICIKTKQDLSNVRIHIETADKEVLLSDFIGTGKVIYPKVIETINNVVMTHNVVSFGLVGIRVTGMEEQQRIDEIRFIIDGTDALRDTGSGF